MSSLVDNIINRKNIRVRGRVEFVAGTVSGINSESGFQKLSAIRDIKVIYPLFFFYINKNDVLQLLSINSTLHFI